MRDYFEELEERNLQPYAVKSRTSEGRHYTEQPSENRTCFQRDRDRIIHSKAFRRLKHKTQVFIATESDHYRSRLTHTVEVAQVSRHLARLLRVNEDLSECIALSHDLGHTAFGHSGEKELNNCMKAFGGFEHNLQSLRIVTFLEKKYPNFRGLNLSKEICDGLMKHQTPWDNPEYNSDPIITIEAQIANVADEIAYNNHDIDDGLLSDIIKDEDLTKQVTLWREAKETIKSNYINLEENELKTLINSYLISSQVNNCYQTTEQNIAAFKIETLKDLQDINESIVSFDREMKEKSKELRLFLFNNFYCHHEVYRMNKKGQVVIRHLFDSFTQDIQTLPEEYRQLISSEYTKERVVADYIAGMTDRFAVEEHKKLFNLSEHNYR
mgnify:CR=1 FL=1